MRTHDQNWLCTGTLNAGESAYVAFELDARAPGLEAIDGTMTTSAVDPDPSNNKFHWDTTVLCQVTGTSGDDTLVAGPGEAACGRGGNDHLIARGESIGLFGGSGDDTFDLSSSTMPEGSDVTLGGDGYDTVTFAGAPNPIWTCWARSQSVSYLGASGQGASVSIGFGLIAGVEHIIGSKYDDFLGGTPEANTIDGGGGNDRIIGGAGHDILDGGNGNDRFMGKDQTRDAISGGAGIDQANVDRTDRTNSTLTQPTPTILGSCD